MTASDPLQPYLPRLVIHWRHDEPDARFREIEGSMVFVDVSGFTAMSERLARQGKVGAEEVSDVIGETFGALLARAYAYDGSLIKFGGDALLLFFDGEAHARRAAAAAHGMREELRGIGTFATTAGKVTLRMSVGAHTGRFQFFLVGDSHRELVIAGPAATETVAMEAAASAGQIVLSSDLAAALPRANRGRAIGPGVLLRGTPPAPEPFQPARPVDPGDLRAFVPRGLREVVEQQEVNPEHRVVTVAFLHYGGFDDLVAREGVTAAAEALDELLGAVQRAVDDRNVAFLATDIAPDGGKIILTAGAPVVTGADEESMLLALREVLRLETPLHLEAGVNRGPVFAGPIGPHYRRTFTVMGDAVNLAARLLARAEHGTVVATPDVLAGSRTAFATEELEPFTVKGKRQPVRAFVVGEPEGVRAPIAEAGLPLVGRERELASLVGAWNDACGGCGRVVELIAEPGMGKSRLLEEALRRLGEGELIRAECRLYQATTPYFPFRALLGRAFDLEELDDREAIERLSRLIDERAPALEPWLSLIATPLGLHVEPSRAVAELGDEFRRARLEQAVDELLAATVDRPAVFLVEDTHWMDEPSSDLLGRIVESAVDRPWLVLLSRRPGSDGFLAAGDLVERIELQPLDADAAAALIAAATERDPLMPRQVRRLAERAAGSPLFLLELLEALRRGDDVDALPDSVEGLIQARIDRLPPGDRTTLRELSVLGAGFRVEHVVSVLAADGAARGRAALSRLGDFVSTDRSGWARFRHVLIRDAAYEGLPYRRRRELHARVGDSIRESAIGPEEQAELLSLHYAAAGRWDEAWTYSRIAGDGARSVYANVEAARFYERALAAAGKLGEVEPGTTAQVAIRLAEVREHAGLFEEALEGLGRARRLVGDDPLALAELRWRRARVLMHLGSFKAAYRETTRGRRGVESSDAAGAALARARLTRVGSALRLMEGRPADARKLAERAVSEAEQAHDRHQLANAYAVLNDALLDLGLGTEAVFAERAREIYAELGELRGLAQVENSIGVRAFDEGRWDDAVDAYRRAQDAYRRAGDELHAAAASGNIGEVLVSQGRFGEAEQLLSEAVRVLRAHGDAGLAVFTEIQLGRVWLARGDVEQAASALERTHLEAVALGIRVLSLEAAIALADAVRAGGEPERAFAVLDDEEKRAGELAVVFGAALARARAETLIADGRQEEARLVVEAGLASAAEQDRLYDRARLLVLRGRIDGTAAEALRESRELLQRLGVIAVPCR